MKGVIWLASGLMLSLLLVSAISVGSSLSLPSLPFNFSSIFDFKNLSQNSGEVFNQVDQLAAVTTTWDTVSDWLSPITNWIKDLWFKFIEAWKHFLGLSPEEPTAAMISPALKEQLRQEFLGELKGQGLANADLLSGDEGGARYGIMVAPSTGSTTRDEWLKKSLSQMFADQVNLKFDKTGMSGVVTPIFRDGRQGGDYIFVLTPLR